MNAGRFNPASDARVNDELAFLAKYPQYPKYPLPWKHSKLFTCVALASAWLAELTTYYFFFQLPADATRWAAFTYTLIRFGVVCVPAYVIWIKLAHRRQGGLPVLASAICLFCA